MFGLPMAVWWLTGGWMARGVVANVAAKAGIGPGAAPKAPVATRVPPRWDAGMDPAVEHAVGRALEVGTVAELRGFADHVTTRAPLYPVAAAVMRYRAQQIEAATRGVATAPHRAPVPVKDPPPPAPPLTAIVAPPQTVPVPVHVNGAAKVPVVEVESPAPAVVAEG